MFRLSWPLQNFLILCIINFGYCSSETFYLWLRTNKGHKCWKCTFLLKNSALKNGRTNLSHQNNMTPLLPKRRGAGRLKNLFMHQLSTQVGIFDRSERRVSGRQVFTTAPILNGGAVRRAKGITRNHCLYRFWDKRRWRPGKHVQPSFTAH